MSRQNICMMVAATLLQISIPFGPTEGFEKKGENAIIANPEVRSYDNEAEIRILHIGDSHVQADFFTGEVRRLLRQYLHDTLPQRGMIFPFAVAGSNNPTDFKSTAIGNWDTLKSTDNRVTESLGVNGIALYTKDIKATITIKIKSENSQFNRVRIFYSAKGGYSPTISGAFSQLKSTMTGDHERAFTINKKADSLTLSIANTGSAEGELIIHGIMLEDTNSKFSYNVSGLNGATTASFVRCKMLQSEVASIKPTIVIISLGTNDAYGPTFSPTELENNLEALIATLHQSVPNAQIVLTTPGDFLAKGHRTTARPHIAAAVINNIAQKHNLRVWDFYKVMGGKGSIRSWRAKGLAAPDYIHLSKDGYRAQGQLFFEWLTGLNT